MNKSFAPQKCKPPAKRKPPLKRLRTAMALAVLAAVGLAGCAGDDGQGQLEIVGNYTEIVVGINPISHTITQSEWVNGFGIFHILTYSNAADFLVARNDTGNAFFPDLFSRFNWVFFQSDLYYCQSPFDAPTEADAEAVDTADRTDPPNGGCNGFSWSRLDPVTL